MDKLVTTSQERFWNPEAYARDRWIEARAEQLARGSWVLDVGAGSSKYRPFFKHCRYQTQDLCLYTGPLVKYLEPIDYLCDVTHIPLGDGALDAILCVEVFEHLPDPMAALKEFSRLLKPEGKLWITAPLLSHVHMEPYHFYGGFTHYWYNFWLPHYGFVLDSVTPVGGPGRTAAFYGQAFYSSWSTAEKKWTPVPRGISKLFRAFAKILFHFVFPRMFPKLDPWLDREKICSGFMVAATRTISLPSAREPTDRSSKPKI